MLPGTRISGNNNNRQMLTKPTFEYPVPFWGASYRSTFMARLYALLTGAVIAVTPVGFLQAAPQDSPGTIYIDGVPCNLPCQAYMAWSRQQLSGQTSTSAASRVARPSRIAKPASKTKAPHIAKSVAPRPSNSAPSRTAAKIAPAPIGSAPTVAANPPSSREEGKIANNSPAASTAPSAADPDVPNDQAATGPVQDTTTATPEQEQQAKTSSDPSASASPDTTAALATPDTSGEMVAILLVRSEIKSASDLANKVIAIDEGSADYSAAELKKAIVAAGATDIQLSEDPKMALVRVIDGDVPAAVATVMPSKAAEVWNAGVSGFNVIRISLPSASQKEKRG